MLLDLPWKGNTVTQYSFFLEIKVLFWMVRTSFQTAHRAIVILAKASLCGWYRSEAILIKTLPDSSQTWLSQTKQQFWHENFCYHYDSLTIIFDGDIDSDASFRMNFVI